MLMEMDTLGTFRSVVASSSAEILPDGYICHLLGEEDAGFSSLKQTRTKSQEHWKNLQYYDTGVLFRSDELCDSEF